MVVEVSQKNKNEHFVWDIIKKLCFPMFCFFGLSWRVLEGLGVVFAGLGAVLGRVGAVLGAGRARVLTPWSLLGSFLEAAWGLLLIVT